VKVEVYLLFDEPLRVVLQTESPAVLANIQHQLKLIMKELEEFAAKQADFNKRDAAAMDVVSHAVTGLTEDIKGYVQKVADLQNQLGAVTPAQKELLDNLEADGNTLTTRTEGVAEALKQLDELTPPTVPAPPIEPVHDESGGLDVPTPTPAPPAA
jgi:prophage DNA circulation protein